MKLQFLVPQYKENDDIIRHLLDSIEIQQNINYDDIGVIICNDGTDIKISQELLDCYSFNIQYYQEKHSGVSATRNKCLDYATAEYIMFCDADDMFLNVCALDIVFQILNTHTCQLLIPSFMEQVKKDDHFIYHLHKQDGTFIHGKIYQRKFLLDNNIRWNEKLFINEDSYFNSLCIKLSDQKQRLDIDVPFYLWKYNSNSTSRQLSPLELYRYLIISNMELVKEFLQRDMLEYAAYYVGNMLFYSFYKLTINRNYDKTLYIKSFSDIVKYTKTYYKLYSMFCDDQIKNIINDISFNAFCDIKYKANINVIEKWISELIK